MREIKFRAWNGKRIINWGFLFTETVSDWFNKGYEMMQFTGLLDQDGFEIYEGDILKHHGIVAWNKIELCWSRIDLNWNEKREWSSLESLTSPLIIIGNIHENPELLK